ncbi:hypothetical protein H696_01806 [Fonticula alba]|uniref:Alpha/beta hydrolase fold-3 domain-containing protein n=1 Tax=Fonticula alba TaxID=691883 RepID=A0A058ZEN8_FONAL|nr:hypothetical protein, variant [Fonticula alba]XP_009493989.1 hypothetical protein H696_01806 [Fonticula alba]KCV72410.1 hypothetical protein H696_01806 [Fonticula alba]KCV72411.1 hypothetical protein, variant [Fonticula alba]|eukprot:XP_009493988.1 hypothetical protein, variant [Fonticula alba]
MSSAPYSSSPSDLFLNKSSASLSIMESLSLSGHVGRQSLAAATRGDPLVDVLLDATSPHGADMDFLSSIGPAGRPPSRDFAAASLRSSLYSPISSDALLQAPGLSPTTGFGSFTSGGSTSPGPVRPGTCRCPPSSRPHGGPGTPDVCHRCLNAQLYSSPDGGTPTASGQVPRDTGPDARALADSVSDEVVLFPRGPEKHVRVRRYRGLPTRERALGILRETERALCSLTMACSSAVISVPRNGFDSDPEASIGMPIDQGDEQSWLPAHFHEASAGSGTGSGARSVPHGGPFPRYPKTYLEALDCLIEIIPRLHDMSRLLRERFDPDYASGLGHGRPAGSLPPDLALTVSVGCQSVLRVLLSYSVALRFRIFEAEGWLTQGEAPQSRLVLFGGGDAERPQSASEAASMRAAPSATGTPGCLSAAFWQRRRSRQIVVREARKAAGMLDIFTLAVNVQLAQADRPPGHVGGPGTVGVLSEQDPLFRSRSSDSPFVLEDDLIRNPALRKWEDLLHQFDPYPFFANPGYFLVDRITLFNYLLVQATASASQSMTYSSALFKTLSFGVWNFLYTFSYDRAAKRAAHCLSSLAHDFDFVKFLWNLPETPGIRNMFEFMYHDVPNDEMFSIPSFRHRPNSWFWDAPPAPAGVTYRIPSPGPGGFGTVPSPVPDRAAPFVSYDAAGFGGGPAARPGSSQSSPGSLQHGSHASSAPRWPAASQRPRVHSHNELADIADAPSDGNLGAFSESTALLDAEARIRRFDSLEADVTEQATRARGLSRPPSKEQMAGDPWAAAASTTAPTPPDSGSDASLPGSEQVFPAGGLYMYPPVKHPLLKMPPLPADYQHEYIRARFISTTSLPFTRTLKSRVRQLPFRIFVKDEEPSYERMVGGLYGDIHLDYPLIPELTPALIFHVHGGGFVAMTSFSHGNYMRQWALDTGLPILSVDYRLAPDFPFPVQLEECWQAYRWAVRNAQRLGTSAERIIIVGDSAGGNLATALTLKIIAEGFRRPDLLVLAYPALYLMNSPSCSRALSAFDPMLNLNVLIQVLRAYNPTHSESAFISPLLAPDQALAEFPPTRIVVGEFDPLLDDSIHLYTRLQQVSHQDVEISIRPRLPHGFLNMTDVVPEAHEAVTLVSLWINEQMSKWGYRALSLDGATTGQTTKTTTTATTTAVPGTADGATTGAPPPRGGVPPSGR